MQSLQSKTMKILFIVLILFGFFGCGSDHNTSNSSCKVYSENDAISSERLREQTGGNIDNVAELVYTDRETFENDYLNAFGENDLSVDFTKNSLVWITVEPGSSSGDITCFQAVQINNVTQIASSLKRTAVIVSLLEA